MTIKEMVELNETADLVEVCCDDYRRVLPVSREFFLNFYKGTDMINTVAKKYILDDYDGNSLGETILRCYL